MKQVVFWREGEGVFMPRADWRADFGIRPVWMVGVEGLRVEELLFSFSFSVGLGLFASSSWWIGPVRKRVRVIWEGCFDVSCWRRGRKRILLVVVLLLVVWLEGGCFTE